MIQNPPNYQFFWHLSDTTPRICRQNMHVEVAVIGGGIAGLSTAQAFHKEGKKVAVFEQYFCASGATGKSGGFITPNAELSLSDFSTNQAQTAKDIWTLINQGVDRIQSNILENKFNCGYMKHPGLFVATCSRTLKNLQEEYENITKLGYPSTFFDKQKLRSVLNTNQFAGAMTYDNSFGINAYEYCKELQQLLEKSDVDIFEETPVLAINDHTITTKHATITADYIIVCVDRFINQFTSIKDQVYHAQNFVLVSQPLSDEEIKQIFPANPYLVWDSELVYNYFRLIPGNRILLGGGDLLSIYANKESFHYERCNKKLINYFKKTFPQIDVQFEYQWPGLIGVSKDVGPIAGPDVKYPHIYYIAASAGLPVATALAQYSAQNILHGRKDLDDSFSPYRKFFIPTIIQKVIGKKLSFAISNFMAQKTLGCFK